jgi:hypothetical protein
MNNFREMVKLEKSLNKLIRLDEKEQPGSGLPRTFSFIVGVFNRKGFTLENQIALLTEAKQYLESKQTAQKIIESNPVYFSASEKAKE